MDKKTNNMTQPGYDIHSNSHGKIHHAIKRLGKPSISIRAMA